MRYQHKAVEPFHAVFFLIYLKEKERKKEQTVKSTEEKSNHLLKNDESQFLRKRNKMRKFPARLVFWSCPEHL